MCHGGLRFIYVWLVWGVVDTGRVFVLGYRHPLGSLRPFVVRFDLTYYDVWSAPAPLGFCAGGSSPSDGRTDPGGGSQTSVYVCPVVWVGLAVMVAWVYSFGGRIVLRKGYVLWLRCLTILRTRF